MGCGLGVVSQIMYPLRSRVKTMYGTKTVKVSSTKDGHKILQSDS